MARGIESTAPRPTGAATTDPPGIESTAPRPTGAATTDPRGNEPGSFATGRFGVARGSCPARTGNSLHATEPRATGEGKQPARDRAACYGVDREQAARDGAACYGRGQTATRDGAACYGERTNSRHATEPRATGEGGGGERTVAGVRWGLATGLGASWVIQLSTDGRNPVSTRKRGRFGVKLRINSSQREKRWINRYTLKKM